MTALGAQTIVPIGQTSSNNSWPFRNPSARYQTGYTAAELGVPAGSQLIEVRVQECQQPPLGTTVFQIPAAPTYNNLRVRVAHSTTDPFSGMSGTFDQNYIGTLQTCLGPTNYNPQKVGQFYHFVLTNPFVVNGTQGIVLDWSFDSTSFPGFYINSPGSRYRVSNSSGNYQSLTGNLVTTGGDWLIHFVFLTGPGLTVTATAGTAETVFADEQGPGNGGFEAGSFTIASNAQSGSILTGIDLAASGTGNDATAFQDVRIYRDVANGPNPGVFDAGDVAIDAAGNFAVDDGTISFSVIPAEQAFGQSETRTYFVVARLAGTALAGQTFDFTISDITTAVGSKIVPANSAMTGFVIDTPVFAVADASLPTPE